jgi:uncharacterized protein (DUF2384 family)
MLTQKDRAELTDMVETMVRESGNPAGFDSERWMSEGVPALVDRRPADLVGTPEGFERVKAVLLRIQSGAYI